MEYRRENTPEGVEEGDHMTDEEKNERLISLYKKTFEKDHIDSQFIFIEPKPKKNANDGRKKGAVMPLKDVLSEQDDQDSDEVGSLC